jgi:hypothetical protein
MRSLGKRLEFGSRPEAAHGRFTLWVDGNTYLVRQCALSVAFGPATVSHRRRQPDAELLLEVSERVTTVVENPTYGRDDFRFIPHPGAQEIFAASGDAQSLRSTAKSGI